MTQNESSGAHLPRPTPVQAAWQDMEMGLFVHFNMFTYSPDPWNWRSFKDSPSPSLFCPDRLDTDTQRGGADLVPLRHPVGRGVESGVIERTDGGRGGSRTDLLDNRPRQYGSTVRATQGA